MFYSKQNGHRKGEGVLAEKERAAKPISLPPGDSYPTYQLYALAGVSRPDPETVLKIAVLETMRWLRERFRERSVPPEFRLPEPSCHQKCSLDDLRDFDFDDGCKAKAVWLPADRIWAFRLTEPDQRTKNEDGSAKRPPVPGRLFQTDVAFRVVNNVVECAFQTTVHEPPGSAAPCEVFRLGLIKKLAANPDVGLRHGDYEIQPAAHRLDSAAAIRRFLAWRNDRLTSLPAVLIPEGAPVAGPSPDPKEIALKIAAGGLLPPIGAPPRPPAPAATPAQPPLLDAESLAKSCMAYAQFFLVPPSQAAVFGQMTGIGLEGAAAVLAGPKASGGEIRVFPARGGEQGRLETQNLLDEAVRSYLKRKTVAFGKALFFDKALSIRRANVEMLRQEKEEIIRSFRRQIEETADSHAEEIRLLKEEAAAKDAKIKRLAEEIGQLNDANALFRQDAQLQRAEWEKQLAEEKAEAARLRRVLARPEEKDLVPAWAEKEFEGRLVFHKRARELLEDAAPNSVDVKLLCDALEYLATDYRDFLLGTVDGETLKLRCSKKYNRPFEVTGNSDMSVAMYPQHYKIKYFIGFKGKPIDSVLDRHLKVGVDNEKLLRIYFLFDECRKIIVVGSLPGHLRTATY